MQSGLHIHEDTYNDDPEISDRQVRIFWGSIAAITTSVSSFF